MIDYIRTYKQFTSSHHFYEGLRMTIAVMTPVLLFAGYGQLGVGMAIAVGALCVGLTDNPGPIHHRRNGMLITLLLVFVTILLTGISAPVPAFAIALIILLPFLFSIIGVYGSRATSAGLACMLVMVLNIDKTQSQAQIVQNALLALLGGGWYFILSLGLHTLRPYKLVQQIVGDCMLETARYLRIKASFYDENVDYNKSYEALTDAQVQVHQKQDMARELLFKTRSIVRESTHTGRVLVMAFIDTLDLFESIMTSQQEYHLLHEKFDGSGLLPAFQKTILQLGEDLDRLGIAFQAGKSLKTDVDSVKSVKQLDDFFVAERDKQLTNDNRDEFISLRHILNSLKDVQHRIGTLYAYSSYDLQFGGSGRTEKELRKFVTRSDFSPKILADNLNLNSNIFRHSIRVSIALLIGYFAGLWLPVGHDYWILLTIIVILKPAYALTRKRNIERLLGTVAGVIIAGILLYTVHLTTILIAIVFVTMVLTYSLVRTSYLPAVVFMTIYVVISFHFLKGGDIRPVLQDRIADTVIGSVIAFATLFLVPPKWEHEAINELCASLVEASKNYFCYIANAFSGQAFENNAYKLKRKATYVALANVGDAFQRMINEPKRKQIKGEMLHQLIVSGHVLVSHIATLSSYQRQYGDKYRLTSFEKVTNLINCQFEEASAILRLQYKETAGVKKAEEAMNDALAEAAALSAGPELRNSIFKTIIDQFEIILCVSGDIKNIAVTLVK